jgi:hypothetical protein
MDHWRNVLGDALLDVQYEQLVADPNMQTRRMLEFCDLKWEASCLKFHESAEAASTASAVQVRKPLYTTSVNRWRRHECELRPLAELLERAGINLAP